MRRVHMVGICGVGMAGVARLLKVRGDEVSGCDARLNPLAEWLESCGIEVTAPHDCGHIDAGTDLVVRTAAVSEDEPEIVAAKRLGIEVRRRGEVLAELVSAAGCSVAVAGTHGKTTTSTFITQLLRGAGRSPAWCIGGMTDDMPVAGGGDLAGEGRHCTGGAVPLVVEADESDGTLALYHPEIAVINNIEFDHMEHFASAADFLACFRSFAEQTRRRVWFCADDAGAAELCGGMEKALGYGFGAGCYLQGELAAGRLLRVAVAGVPAGEVPLPAAGRHNALNALAAIGVCLDLGVSFEEIASAFGGVSLPRRRYDTVAEINGALVISDYAHHPSEVRALTAMAREELAGGGGRILALFQPHRYTRTLALGADFPSAFEGVDELVLLPVYAASEQPLQGGGICDLYARFAEREEWRGRVKLAECMRQAQEYLRRKICPGDILLVTGAGDVEQVAHWFRKLMIEQKDGALRDDLAGDGRHGTLVLGGDGHRCKGGAELGRLTMYGIGGVADCFVEVEDMAGLQGFLADCARRGVRPRILGGGSNVLISDCGVREPVVRLRGELFGDIRIEGDVVIAGAAVPAARLLAHSAQAGLGGLEFLAGIPGTVGGLARMNAGAYGGEFGNSVLWIRGLKYDGSECKLSADNLKWVYRGCPQLRDIVVTEVALRLKRRAVADVFADLEDARGRRAWQRGLRCAGSVFKNPAGELRAGELIERAGLKGRVIGGACIYEEHANFITVEKDACASDVVALMRLAEAAVADMFGIELRREVEVWG